MNNQTAGSARFWDKIAPSYAKKPVPDEDAYQQTLERVRSYLAPTDRMLELGCGTGSTALLLCGAAREIWATDVSPKMIEIARQKADAKNIDNAHFSVGTLDDPAPTETPFDIVGAFNLLHLLADIPKSLSRVSALLKPGGYFISKTPCVGELGSAARVGVSVLRFFGKAPAVNFFTKSELEQMVQAAGFDIVETGIFPKKKKNGSLFIVAQKADA